MEQDERSDVRYVTEIAGKSIRESYPATFGSRVQANSVNKNIGRPRSRRTCAGTAEVQEPIRCVSHLVGRTWSRPFITWRLEFVSTSRVVQPVQSFIKPIGEGSPVCLRRAEW